jgi:hypothetical protein
MNNLSLILFVYFLRKVVDAGTNFLFGVSVHVELMKLLIRSNHGNLALTEHTYFREAWGLEMEVCKFRRLKAIPDRIST